MNEQMSEGSDLTGRQMQVCLCWIYFIIKTTVKKEKNSWRADNRADLKDWCCGEEDEEGEDDEGIIVIGKRVTRPWGM